jgi:hypothetical protein
MFSPQSERSDAPYSGLLPFDPSLLSFLIINFYFKLLKKFIA